MPKPNILIVPDIHENMSTLRHIEDTLIPQADHVVMLGDFWDTLSPHKQAKDAAQWVKAHIHEPCVPCEGTGRWGPRPAKEEPCPACNGSGLQFTILWGNHDCHYAFAHPYFLCSGYNRNTKIAIDSVLTSADWQRFKVYTKIGKYTISHAGFHPETIGFMDPIIVDQALALAFAGEYSHLWAAGRIRGGDMRYGGPTWLDWNHEFEPMQMPQIVGHTKGTDVRVKSWDDGDLGGPRIASYCLDSELRHAMWTDGDKVEIVKL